MTEAKRRRHWRRSSTDFRKWHAKSSQVVRDNIEADDLLRTVGGATEGLKDE